MKEQTRAELALLAATLLWGSTFIVVKGALSHASLHGWLFVRFCFGFLAALPFAFRDLGHRQSRKVGLLLGGVAYGGFFLQTWGLDLLREAYRGTQGSAAARSAFLTGLSVVLVPVAAFALFRRRAHPFALAGAGVAALGLYAMSSEAMAVGGARTLAGDLATLACAGVFALQIVFLDRFAKGLKAAATLCYELAAVAGISLLAIPFEGFRFEGSPRLWGDALFCGVVASALCFGAQVWAQARTTALRAALIFALEPVFAVAWAFALEGELPSQREVIGGALIVAGVLLGELGPQLGGRPRPAGPSAAAGPDMGVRA